MKSSSSRHVHLVSSSWVVKPLETNQRATKFVGSRPSRVSALDEFERIANKLVFVTSPSFSRVRKAKNKFLVSASTVDNIEVLFIRIYLSFALTRRETFFFLCAHQSTIDGKKVSLLPNSALLCMQIHQPAKNAYRNRRQKGFVR